MSRRILWESIILALALCGWGLYIQLRSEQPQPLISPVTETKTFPLARYTIPNLIEQPFAATQIVLDTPTATTASYTTYLFHYASEGKKVTGVANIPKLPSKPSSPSASIKLPVIVQFRGYVDPAAYTPGEGTIRSGQVFAEHGFITLAPDFLGYGGSASGSADVFEDRFETYTTALSLLASIQTLPMADSTRVGLWGHSNGGHITLAVKEITGKPYPTVLWAPVSKPFPYSILYYTDDADDHGKSLRKELAKFEEDYDVDLYSVTNYFDRITGPMQLHQGTADEAVPFAWSNLLAKTLKDKGKDISYFTYPGADHNMLGAWNTVVLRDIDFFTKNLR